ncbi:MAG: hypothetical protein NZ700_12350 [Gemmataceae bacterium]|nr:hypothetical protein [Gemmataceae bacterium]MDW8265855.1 hypothetical protein [Gemmataceae bacterium]
MKPTVNLRGSPDTSQCPPLSLLALLGLGAALVAGAALRFGYSQDIEYKADQEWTFRKTQTTGRSEPWSWVGMPSSFGIPNPGFSDWVFIVPARLFRISSPPSLARFVAATNFLALLLLMAFAWRWVPADEREPWLWAAALLAVNPQAVIMHRCIWLQALLPIFSLGLLVAWWHRSRPAAALAWGLVGALIGQLHMTGFLYAFAFVAWTALFDRRSARWGLWLVGSILGAVPLLPWLVASWPFTLSRPVSDGGWRYVATLPYWQLWVSEPLAVGMPYHVQPHFTDYLAEPLWSGQPTYLVYGAYLGIIAVAAALAATAGLRLLRTWPGWMAAFIGRSSPSAFAQNAALWGYGLLLTLPGVTLHPHYLTVTFPLQYVWLTRLGLVHAEQPAMRRWARGLLAVLWLLQLVLSVVFLRYIHIHQGIPDGPFGTVYGAQPR